jgi:hypothetical protein
MFRKDLLTLSVFSIPEEPEIVLERSLYLCLYSPYRKSLKISRKDPFYFVLILRLEEIKILNIPLTVFSSWKSRMSSGKILLPCLFSLHCKSLKIFRKDPLTLSSLYRKSLKIFRKDPLTLSLFSLPQEPENLQERSFYLVCILCTGRA